MSIPGVSVQSWDTEQNRSEGEEPPRSQLYYLVSTNRRHARGAERTRKMKRSTNLVGSSASAKNVNACIAETQHFKPKFFDPPTLGFKFLCVPWHHAEDVRIAVGVKH